MYYSMEIGIAINEATPLVMLTLGQLKQALAPTLTAVQVRKAEKEPTKKYIKGLNAIKNHFGVGKNTACNWCQPSGLLGPAVYREGRIIILDVEKGDAIVEAWTGKSK